MGLPRRHRRALKRLSIGLLVLGSIFVAVTPALAYGLPVVKWARVDTETCERTGGTLAVVVRPTGCLLSDSADSTFFRKDSGGLGLKVELWVDNSMVAKVEFHPNGELLWIYDTRNDGDAIYAQLCYFPANEIGCVDYGGLTAPEGTSNSIDYTIVHPNLAENTKVGLILTDGPNFRDVLARFTDYASPYART